MAINGEFPILEHLIIATPSGDKSVYDLETIRITSSAASARPLYSTSRLVLISFAIPIRSRLLITTIGLVTLALVPTDGSTRFHPNGLLQWLSESFVP
jgi:hypothetical protein